MSAGGEIVSMGVDERHSAAKAELNKQIDKLGTSALAIKEQRDDLAAVLRDLAMGADMMLEPVMGATGYFKKFAEEVRRVARAGLKEAGL